MLQTCVQGLGFGTGQVIAGVATPTFLDSMVAQGIITTRAFTAVLIAQNPVLSVASAGE